MIIDLPKFIVEEKPYWMELEKVLEKLAGDPGCRLGLKDIERFHYLYQRASADLSRMITFSAEPNMRTYLESLVGRAYGEIHETRDKAQKLNPLRWFFSTFPQTFRRRICSFWLCLTAMLVGALFGGFVVATNPDLKEVLLPFSHLMGDPSDRVAWEESAEKDRIAGSKATFSSQLMTNNIRVAIRTLALGITWGIGTIIMLFYNGVILGAVALDYIWAGESKFLVGWLLPHGATEIPAILIAGQAGLVLGGALIGWGKPIALKSRLKEVANDLVTLILGVAILLIWAGIVEAFFSQYHEPVIPYELKTGFGLLELTLLIYFFAKAGQKKSTVSKVN